MLLWLAHWLFGTCFSVLMFSLYLILSDKAPFDLIKAGSELVDGAALATVGIAFSFLFACGNCVLIGSAPVVKLLACARVA